MLQNILNLDGVTVLNKKQQNSVNGGRLQECRFTVTMNGQTRVFNEPGYEDGAAGSAQANDACVAVLENTQASRCFYDCSYDGYGQ
jgi:hypothetical protein